MFDHVAVFREITVDVTGGDEPEQVQAAAVTEDYFSVIGVEPVLGRAFAAEEQQRGNNLVVILSDGLWRRRFGSEPAVLGNVIGLNGQQFHVVGIMPPHTPMADIARRFVPDGLWNQPSGFCQALR